MSTNRDERALSELLDEIKDADARLEPPAGLEERMMARFSEAQAPVASRARAQSAAIAAMLAAGVGLAVWLASPRQDLEVGAPASAPLVGAPLTGAPQVNPDPEVPMFLALRPDAQEALTGSGSVQVARVRVSRELLADLGVVIDGDRVGEPMQADVLFGEDGLARAIRLVPVSGRTEW
jgi:hypothetical protein